MSVYSPPLFVVAKHRPEPDRPVTTCPTVIVGATVQSVVVVLVLAVEVMVGVASLHAAATSITPIHASRIVVRTMRALKGKT
jgi:hypothetical protein